MLLPNKSDTLAAAAGICSTMGFTEMAHTLMLMAGRFNVSTLSEESVAHMKVIYDKYVEYGGDRRGGLLKGGRG